MNIIYNTYSFRQKRSISLLSVHVFPSTGVVICARV